MKSIVSYPERGEGGNNLYRGNCSPKLIEDLIDFYKPEHICDYMCGSGTTGDACKKKGITSSLYDLNRGFSLLDNDLPEQSEFTFWHPPYWDIVKYSDGQYSAKEIMEKYGIDSNKKDLSRISTWEEFVRVQNQCMMKLYTGLEKGGRLAVLMGDIKKKGRLYSQICEIAKPGQIEQIIIKAQHNCFSDSTYYSNRNFIPIVHEYVLVVRKEHPLFFTYQYTQTKELDIRDMKLSSWRSVVYEVMESFGKNKEVSLSNIYKMIEGHKKTLTNPHWKDKVRQILNSSPNFASKQRGYWYLAV